MNFPHSASCPELKTLDIAVANMIVNSSVARSQGAIPLNKNKEEIIIDTFSFFVLDQINS